MIFCKYKAAECVYVPVCMCVYIIFSFVSIKNYVDRTELASAFHSKPFGYTIEILCVCLCASRCV